MVAPIAAALLARLIFWRSINRAGETGVGGMLWAVLALFDAAPGVLIERWLVSAAAQHVVMLYYGAEAA